MGKKSRIAGLFIELLLLGMVGVVFADDHERDKHHESKKHQERQALGSDRIPLSEDALAHINACGGCHFTYQPFLLPSASWNSLMDNLDDHFGQVVELNADEVKTLRKYLDLNAADHSNNKISRKITKSISGEPVLRISEVPYIVRKHKDDDIPANVFQRKSVGSLGNCSACHTKADQGIYDDDYVRIPN
ncbi:MAG: diheme cytochrome c [Anaerolineaceae bacterium]|nr:diheme cytochrome c [Anaerolineaceae bacterium]